MVWLTTVCLSIHGLKDILVVNSFGELSKASAKKRIFFVYEPYFLSLENKTRITGSYGKYMFLSMKTAKISSEVALPFFIAILTYTFLKFEINLSNMIQNYESISRHF